jgi:hypothetical protein
MDLHYYWGDSGLNFVMYAVPKGTELHLNSQRLVLLTFTILHDSHPDYEKYILPAED